MYAVPVIPRADVWRDGPTGLIKEFFGDVSGMGREADSSAALRNDNKTDNNKDKY